MSGTMSKRALLLPVLIAVPLLSKTPQIGDDEYGTPRIIGTITDRQLDEVSGLVQSSSGAFWWVLNDSGNAPRIYAIEGNGRLLARFNVSGAKQIDWEDLARGPGRDGKPALYIADAGNNNLDREELTIYRVPEPRVSRRAQNDLHTGKTAPAEAFRFRYPEGKHDAEALFVDPETGRPYLVTKELIPPCGVYRFPLPLSATRTVVLEKVHGDAIKVISGMMLVTGAATSPDGKRVTIRTYLTALELVRSGEPFESLFKAQPRTVRIPIEKQGEAISYTASGMGLVTTSEKVPAPLFEMDRRKRER
jgi:hypothetical protein